jgi:hypothetical protein
MLALLPIPPVVGWARSVRLAGDHYIRSGHPRRRSHER